MKHLCERPLPMRLLLNELLFTEPELVRLNKLASIAKFPFQFKDFTASGDVRAARTGAGRCCRSGVGSHPSHTTCEEVPARPL